MVNSSVSRQWFWDRKAIKAPRVYGGGALLDKMSRSDGGDVGLVAVGARGMSAMLGGLDAVMTESPSPSSKTDDGCGEDSLGDGLGDIRTGDCPRIRDLGILPAGCPVWVRDGVVDHEIARLAKRQTSLVESRKA
jgi:hypothetical protein